ENFIRNVPELFSSLPPVIDIEIDTNKDVQKIQTEIMSLSNRLENHFKKKPILYVTYSTYNKYIKGKFNDNEIWIRDIIKRPNLKGQRKWAFWQYNNRGRVSGIKSYVDINVFNGDQEEFDKKYRY